jgi:CubicO group peptidase (beta-lactamase class C family)
MPRADEAEERIGQVETNMPIPDPSGHWRTASLEERMERYGVPGASVAVLQHGKVEWSRGYGLRDLAAGDPITSHTLFQAASISKPIAALAALRLADRGDLDLDRDVNTLLRSWQVSFDSTVTPAEPVTARRLLSHSAGLTVHGFPGYERGADVPSLLQILDGASPANTEPVRVDTAPGTLIRYSGGGYCVLQQLLIDLTGQEFPSLMRELVCEPAGMTHSTFEQPPPRERWAELATAYRSGPMPVPGNWHVYPEMAAAGLWTTPIDLLRVAIALQEARAGAAHALLSPECTQELFTPQVTGEVGLGFFLHGRGSEMYFSHGGANEGFRCEMVAYADVGSGAAVMTNADSGGFLAHEVLGAIAKVYGWPNFRKERAIARVGSDILHSYAGEYEFSPPESDDLSVPAHVDHVRNRLVLSVEGGAPLELIPESDTSFFTSGMDGTIDFVHTEGAGWEMILRRSMMEISFSKVR